MPTHINDCLLFAVNNINTVNDKVLVNSSLVNQQKSIHGKMVWQISQLTHTLA